MNAYSTGTLARVVVVGAPGCHYCEDAEAAFAALGIEAYQLEHVDAASDRGVALLRRHRAPMLPLVVIDGEFFSAGRLPRSKFRAWLSQQAVR